MVEDARPKTRSEQIEEMLIRVDRERPVDLPGLAKWNALKSSLDTLRNPFDLGAALDEYFGNPPWVPAYDGVGDPTRPSTWIATEPSPPTFEDQYPARQAPPPPPPPAGYMPVPPAARTGELLIQAASLLTRASPIIRNVGGSLHEEIEAFLKGMK